MENPAAGTLHEMPRTPSRLTLLLRGLRANRGRPDLAALEAQEDPGRFLWAVLPHAARSFGASIVILPRRQARAAAVAYLYARMLDTYEDLWPEESERVERLIEFAARWETTPPRAAIAVPDTLAQDARDRVHLILVRKASLIDQVYATLPAQQQAAIAALVREMAAGMVWSTERFIEQDGVLADRQQLLTYCRNVIGHPAVYAYELLTGSALPARDREDAFAVGEMVQLANITRDIEKDLQRGIAYDPSLRPHFDGNPAEAVPVVTAVHASFMSLALRRVPAYRRLFEAVPLGRRPSARLAAVLLLSFTDLHYRRLAGRVGVAVWDGPRGPLSAVLRALPSLVSERWARRAIRRIEGRFLAAADELDAAA